MSGMTATMIMIILGRSDEMDLEESPDIGLYVVDYYVNGGLGYYYALIYTDDVIPYTNYTRYKQGFLAKNSIGDIRQAVDLRNGGGVMQSQTVQFSLRNTQGLKDILDDLVVSLNGKRVYVIDHTWDVDANGAAVNGKAEVLFVGRSDNETWGETTLTFSATPNFEAERRGNMMIDGLPVTFGFNHLAKWDRVDKPVNIPQGVFTGIEDDNELEFRVVNWGRRFLNTNPVRHSYQYLLLELENDRDSNWSDAIDRLNALGFTNGNFFCLTSDGGSDGFGAPIMAFSNSMRSFTYGYNIPDEVLPNPNQIICILARQLPDDVVPEYVTFARGEVVAMCDGWPNNVSNIAANTPYYSDDGRLAPLTPYAEHKDYYSKYPDPTLPDRHAAKLLIDTKEIGSADKAEMPSLTVIPVKRLEVMSGDIEMWSVDGDLDEFSEVRTSGGDPTGLYAVNPSSTTYGSGKLYDPQNAIDGNLSTAAVYTGTNLTPINKHLYALRVVLPDPPQGANITDAYIAVKMEVWGNYLQNDIRPNISIRVRERRAIDHITDNRDIVIPTGLVYGEYSAYIDDYPILTPPFRAIEWPNNSQHSIPPGGKDIYDPVLDEQLYDPYSGSPWTVAPTTGGWAGYRTFRINGLDFTNGRRKECLIILGELQGRPNTPSPVAALMHIYGIGVAFENMADISKSVYLQTPGRMFDDVWRAGIGTDPRKPANARINSPVDVVEMSRRLSCWEEMRGSRRSLLTSTKKIAT